MDEVVTQPCQWFAGRYTTNYRLRNWFLIACSPLSPYTHNVRPTFSEGEYRRHRICVQEHPTAVCQSAVFMLAARHGDVTYRHRLLQLQVFVEKAVNGQKTWPNRSDRLQSKPQLKWLGKGHHICIGLILWPATTIGSFIGAVPILVPQQYTILPWVWRHFNLPGTPRQCRLDTSLVALCWWHLN